MIKNWKEYKGHKVTTTGTKKKIDNTIYTFDIETTSYLVLDGKVHETIDYLQFDKKEQERCIKQACMYIWMVGINDQVYYGRTWDEFIKFLDVINTISPYRKYFFVHNLSWEFQFIKSIFKMKKVSARKSHKVMSCEIEEYPIIFRCSYMMSNCSLEKLSEQFNLPIKKKKGDLDYSKIRISKTEIYADEFGYCEYDCLVLYTYIKKELEEYGTLQKLPSTATGKVRRALHGVIDHDKDYRRFLYKAINVDPHVYNLLVDAFAGGYTHANWLYADEIMKNVTSYDFSSSYPFCLLVEKYPSTKFRKSNITNLDDMLPMFAYLIKIRLTDISSLQFNTFISKNKCLTIKGGTYDNGRVIKAKHLEMVITDVDWQYIKKSYKFNYEILECWYSIYDYLPKPIINFILDMYKEKTQLKGIEEQADKYARIKAMFNSVYGMMVTRNIRDTVEYDNIKGWTETPLKNKDIEDKLQKEQRICFLNFAWGCWCTAYARRNLINNILQLDTSTIYVDTDSLKLKEGFDINVILNYNKSVVNKIKQVCKDLDLNYEDFEPKDIKGIKHLIGAFDKDGSYKFFRSNGAKKYAYIKEIKKEKVKETTNVVKDYGATCDVLEITVSGVPKEGARDLHSLEEFTDDLEFTYKNTNKNVLFYCENQEPIEITDYQGNVSIVNDKSGCCLIPTTYKMAKAFEYTNLLYDQASERAKYYE